MVNKKQLAKPTRESLSTPTRLLKSRSSVVNAPVGGGLVAVPPLYLC